ncbi:hypothetical protein LTR05_000416 [Lithohypha guttulata]|uniref:Long-chain-alcohol oxidase n=1 Tax=Lithohypha guttulata TaxID=1690604 RepID=A0AAN7T6C0_9EURO|nr:hypothetical protein LTR05_000416 [Lithohypha guttulata]
MLGDEKLSTLASLPTPLPSISSHEVFTPEQWDNLLSICEVFVPDLSSQAEPNLATDRTIEELRQILPESESPDLIEKYLADTVAGNADFKEALRRRFVAHVPEDQVKGLAFLLSALDTRIGSLAMTGTTKILHTQNLPERSRIVLDWANSYIGALRALYQAAESLTRLLDYPKVPKDIERHPGYEFEFLEFSDQPEDKTVQVDADIVIVGSGCGAGVVAEHLSASLSDLPRKLRILVLEKSYHFPSSHFPMDQTAAGNNVQEGGGGLISDDGSIAVLAGSVFGGGGTINWSASLQPSHHVRSDWATKNQLPFVLSQDFQACLDAVCGKMGVCRANDLEGLSKIEQNIPNSMLLESARRLGLAAEVVPQNTAGKRHYCGRCGMGCASATKQGPANFWFPEAAKNGVEFIEGCFVEKICWDSVSSERKATGVKAIWTSRSRDIIRKLKINASYVIVSSGTLQSPLLLHRSGLTPEVNKNIGSNLHLHPTINVRGTYPQRIDPWDGAILTSAMTTLDNLDGKGHGPKIEVMLGIPELMAAVLPFRPQLSTTATTTTKSNGQTQSTTSLDWRLRIAKHGHSFTYIIIQRDHADANNSPKSYVYMDPADPRKVKISYTPSLKDRQHLLEGIIVAAKMHFVMGADFIDPTVPNILPFERPSTKLRRSGTALPTDKDQQHTDMEDNTAFTSWLSTLTSTTSPSSSLINPQTTRLGSAHQMSTCRMSASPSTGVVDPSGRVWGTDNVYVADASILPSASGVNPMVSTMAFALWVARGLVGRVGREVGRGAGEVDE